MTTDAPAKYWAFISYSSKDREWGDWLHRAIERYKVPKALVGRATERGDSVPPRLFPVFRDREELPTADDLGEMLQKSIERSRYLIVICSPHSARSRWVAEEILSFKRLGREHKIIALIVDGSPNASETVGREAEECFPAPLRFQLDAEGNLTTIRTHPIAADARPSGDGKQNALLKLLAGLLGVGFDELKRRDEEYRRLRLRRLQMAAASVTGLALFAAGAAWLAWRAEKQVGQQLNGEREVQLKTKALLARGQVLVENGTGERPTTRPIVLTQASPGTATQDSSGSVQPKSVAEAAKPVLATTKMAAAFNLETPAPQSRPERAPMAAVRRQMADQSPGTPTNEGLVRAEGADPSTAKADAAGSPPVDAAAPPPDPGVLQAEPSITPQQKTETLQMVTTGAEAAAQPTAMAQRAKALRSTVTAVQQKAREALKQIVETLSAQQAALHELQVTRKKLANDTDTLNDQFLKLASSGREMAKKLESSVQAHIAGPLATARQELEASLSKAMALQNEGGIKVPYALIKEVEGAKSDLDEALANAGNILPKFAEGLEGLDQQATMIAEQHRALRMIEEQTSEAAMGITNEMRAWAVRENKLDASDATWMKLQAELERNLAAWDNAVKQWKRAEQAWKDYLAGFRRREDDRWAIEAILQESTKANLAQTESMLRNDIKKFAPKSDELGDRYSVQYRPIPPQEFIELKAAIDRAHEAAARLRTFLDPAIKWLAERGATAGALAKLQEQTKALAPKVASALREINTPQPERDGRYADLFAQFESGIRDGGVLSREVEHATAELTMLTAKLNAAVNSLPHVPIR